MKYSQAPKFSVNASRMEEKDIKFHHYHYLNVEKINWETDVGFMIAGNTIYLAWYNENSMDFQRRAYSLCASFNIRFRN